MKKFRENRLKDAISFRVSDRQRLYIETLSKKTGCGICKTARSLLDEAIIAHGNINVEEK